MMIVPFSVLSIGLAVLFGPLSEPVLARDRIEVAGTNEILITPLTRSEKHRRRHVGDEALLIRDRSTIGRFVQLFDGNRQLAHACGYHWQITFIRADSSKTEVFFNEKCEEFERDTKEICKLVQAKFIAAVSAPNRYVSVLDIDVRISPKSVKEELSKASLVAVELDRSNRFPFIEISASSSAEIPDDRRRWDAAKMKVAQDADRKLMADLELIRNHYSVLTTRGPDRKISMFGGGTIDETRRFEVYFDIGTDLDPISDLLENSKIESKVVPVTYRIHALSEKRLSRSSIESLKRSYPFVREIRSSRF
jgi:hypothetical protein